MRRLMAGAELVGWLQQRGAVVHPALDFFAADTPGGEGGCPERSVVALEPIQAGEVLVSLPPGSFIRFGSGPFAPCPQLSGLSPLLSAALQLLRIRATGSAVSHAGVGRGGAARADADEWGLYLRSLPASYATPASWTSAQLDGLGGTMINADVLLRLQRQRLGLGQPTAAAVTNICSSAPASTPPSSPPLPSSPEHALQQHYEDVVRSLATRRGVGGGAEAVGCCSAADLRWACDSITSRSFQLPAVDGGGRCMLPLMDMLNHCAWSDPRRVTTLRYSRDCGSDGDEGGGPVHTGSAEAGFETFTMVAERPIEAGTEIRHCYGAELTDGQLVASYGFATCCAGFHGGGGSSHYRSVIDLPLRFLPFVAATKSNRTDSAPAVLLTFEAEWHTEEEVALSSPALDDPSSPGRRQLRLILAELARRQGCGDWAHDVAHEQDDAVAELCAACRRHPAAIGTAVVRALRRRDMSYRPWRPLARDESMLLDPARPALPAAELCALRVRVGERRVLAALVHHILQAVDTLANPHPADDDRGSDNLDEGECSATKAVAHKHKRCKPAGK